MRIAADLNNLSTIRSFIDSVNVNPDVNQDALDDMILAVDEAVTNIIVHGYQKQKGEIEIIMQIIGNNLHVYLRDDAPEFDPTQVSTPNLSLPLNERPLGGMGIHLIRSFTDEIYHQALQHGGNRLVLIKHGVLTG